MIEGAIVCAVIAALSSIIFASMCVRPALRLRGVIERLQSNPALLAAIRAQESSRSIASAAATIEPAARRLGAAGVSIANALVSIAGFRSQVAATADVVESLLGLVVPRLRGMLL